jgi:alpha-galactosidase
MRSKIAWAALTALGASSSGRPILPPPPVHRGRTEVGVRRNVTAIAYERNRTLLSPPHVLRGRVRVGVEHRTAFMCDNPGSDVRWNIEQRQRPQRRTYSQAIALTIAAFALNWACSIAIAQDAPTPAQTPAQTREQLRLAAIRTPAAPATPRINGPRIFGARPGHPFFYHVPATGDRPIAFSARGLPAGLSLDPSTGNITGQTSDAGAHAITLTATNAQGTATIPFSIVIGPTICLTPPMGWNSWNFFAAKIDDPKTRGAADSMVNTGLVDHGWTYINIDDTWEIRAQGGAVGRDTDGRILTNSKFPDMKALSDYIHSKGLKFGIYSSPGPTTCAGYFATYQHEDQDAQSYADWGVDYVKYDWCSYGTIAAKITLDKYGALLSPDDATKLKDLSAQQAALPPRNRRTADQTAQARQLATDINALEGKVDPDKKKAIDLAILQAPYAQFRQSLDKVNRDIVYSLCQYGNGDVWTWGDSVGGNLWRTTGDINATWNRMATIGFGQNPHAPYAGPGHWNDPDMLEVGNGNLTPDENYTHMTLWCMLASPLLIGCDMPNMDKFTVSLFSNDEVLAVDQDALGKQGTRLKADGTSEVWTKPLADGTTAVALFNRGSEPATISAIWLELKLDPLQPIRDLWRKTDLNPTQDALSGTVNAHGAELYRIGIPRAGQ